MSKTIFEKIIDGEIPAKIIYDDDMTVAFHDVSPKAPVHILVVPKSVIVNLAAATDDDGALLGHLLLTAAKVADEQGLSESGYRIVINNGPDGGQTVDHLHVHLLGGRHLTWPPG